MKKSRIAKFALLGASAAALAATLSTSTYAWYVSNQKADVTASTGSTASADSDGSISLSTSGAYGEFYKTITLGNFANAALLPVNTTNGTTFTKIVGDNGTNPTMDTATIATVGAGASDTAAGCVYHYCFYVLNSGSTAVNIIPSITVTNTTAASLPTQVSYGTVPGVTKGQQFSVNALNVLTMTMTSTTDSVAYADGYTWTADTTSSVSGQILSGVNTANGTQVCGKVTTVNENAHTGTFPSAGARAYYEEISELDLTTTQETPFAPAADMANISIPSLKPVRLDYYLFLDGADDQCYNACENQTFSVEFSYQVANS